MSVFSFHTGPRYARILGIFFAVFSVVVGSIIFGQAVNVPLTASLIGGSPPSYTTVPIAMETVFPNPRSVDWEGVVFGVLTGGQGIAVRSESGPLFQAYMQSGQIVPVTEGPVRVHGRQTGISCAYANTVFDGQCTPTVDIESLEALPIVLQ